MSDTQRRLWFLSQLEPESTRYQISIGLRLSGDLSVPMLERALAAAVHRHEALITRFTTKNGMPHGVVGDPPPLTLLPQEIEDPDYYLAEEGALPLDLEDRLLRARLLRRSYDEHLLLITAHRLVCDPPSACILLEDLAELYRAEHLGRQPRLAAAVPYRGDPPGPNGRPLAYWRRQLEDAPLVLDLPTDRPHRGLRADPAERVAFTIDGNTTQGLTRVGREVGGTPAMAVLAAYFLLLGRYSGSEDVVVGLPMPGERIVGPCDTMVPMRCRPRPDVDFKTFLSEVRATWHAAEEFALPFALLVDELRPARVLGRSPLFQATFAVETDVPPPRLPGVDVQWLTVPAHNAEFELSLTVREVNGQLDCRFIYSADLFSGGRVTLMAATLQNLLRQLAAEPTRPMRDLTGVGEKDRLLLRDLNDTTDAFSDVRVCHLVERQAARTPDATAVVIESNVLTYGELNLRADELAGQLREMGAGPERVVAILLDRSFELVVALLATLKTGAAFLLMDPDHPSERHEQAIEETKPVALVKTTAEAAFEPVRVDQGLVRPEHLAYIVYTSGSTGRPKGVQNIHRGLSNRIRWMSQTFGIGPDDAVLQKAPNSVDTCIWELLWPLTAGARLVLARPGGHRDSDYLAALVQRERVTIADFVPTVLAMFVEVADVAERCTSLRMVICGGEQMSPELKERFLERLPGAALWNLYGPSETSIGVLSWTCEPKENSHSVPIGRPIANTQAYVCDDTGQLVPTGVAGELHIGGAAVGRGYLAAPRQTAERFVPDRFGTIPGQRIYRTGDLARMRPDGVVEFLGRVDRQVKLHGVRAEPGEVESVLAEHKAVRDVAVVVRTGVDGPQLVAYVRTQADGTPPSMITELRGHARRRLHPAMVPSTFVLVPKLPVTLSGKLDISSLPDPDPKVSAASAVALPRSRAELTLIRIWERILNGQPVGVHDDFFAIGGDSLLAVRLVAELKDNFGVRLPLAEVFERPTVAAQASLLGEIQDSAGPLVVLREGGGAAPLWCVPSSTGLSFPYLHLVRSLPGDLSVYGFEARGLRPGERPLATVPGIAANYLAQAQHLQGDRPWLLAGWSTGAVVATEMARQLGEQGRQVALLARFGSAPVVEPGKDDDAAVLAELLRHEADMSGEDLAIEPALLAIMEPSARRSEVFARLHRAGVLPTTAGEPELSLRLSVFVAHRHALRRHRPTPHPKSVLRVVDLPTGRHAAVAAELARHLERACASPHGSNRDL